MPMMIGLYLVARSGCGKPPTIIIGPVKGNRYSKIGFRNTNNLH